MTLAKDLGISRTPVREALLELSAQGLVIFLPRKGVLVKHFTRKDVEEIFELRRVIELAAMEKVTGREPPCDLSKLKKHLDDQRKAVVKKDFTGFMKADRAFHATFCDLTDNRRLSQIIENIRDLIHFMGMQGLGTTGRAEVVIQEHERVLKAVAQGDTSKARKEMEHHLNLSEQAVPIL
jgi:DNA-binding GntR family transcriptional regulator